MKLQHIFSMMLITLLAVATTTARAADKKELQARFERRYPQLLEYKVAGKIGETTAGIIEAVDPKYMDDAKLSKLVSDENTDRLELYKLIAKEEGTTPDVVAQRTAKRNYEKAKPGEYLKTADGKWKKKS